jgi:hypothetical protein
VQPLFCCKLRSSSNPTSKYLTESKARFKQLYLGNNSELDTCSYEHFFLTITDRDTDWLTVSSDVTLTVTKLSLCSEKHHAVQVYGTADIYL